MNIYDYVNVKTEILGLITQGKNVTQMYFLWQNDLQKYTKGVP